MERGMQIKDGLHKVGWEVSDFPLACRKCLGLNPFLRMLKMDYGRDCKICGRPYTVFRWKPDSNSKYAKTEICQTCAKIKNVCQACILDLEYGLPVEIRDKFMDKKYKIEIPKDEINRDFWAHEVNLHKEELKLNYDKKPDNKILEELSKKYPIDSTTKPDICTFDKKGQCNRGTTCPYRHAQKEESTANISAKYTGLNDPIAKKILGTVVDSELPKAPENKDIMTLFVGGIVDSITEQDIKNSVCSYGEVKKVKMLYKQSCAFVSFTSRQGAEIAMQALHDRFYINDTRLKLLWARYAIE